MHRTRPLARPILAALALLISTTARADFELAFGQGLYTVSPGDELDVPIVLSENGGTILASEGLFTVGFVAAFNVAPFASDPAQVIDRAANPGFDMDFDSTVIPAASSSAGSATFDLAAFINPFVFPDAATPDRITLGTLRFRAGSIPGEQTILTLSDLDVGLDNFVTGEGQVLDSLITFAASSIRVSVVPEPSSIALIALGTAAGLLVLRTTRRVRSNCHR